LEREWGPRSGVPPLASYTGFRDFHTVLAALRARLPPCNALTAHTHRLDWCVWLDAVPRPRSGAETTPHSHPPPPRVSTLRRGSFGKVYRAQHKRSKEVFAVKVMNRDRIKASSIFREYNVLGEEMTLVRSAPLAL